jgi:hypothetical protein
VRRKLDSEESADIERVITSVVEGSREESSRKDRRVLKLSMSKNSREASYDHDNITPINRATEKRKNGDDRGEAQLLDEDQRQLVLLAQQDVAETFHSALLRATPTEALTQASRGKGEVTVNAVVALLAGQLVDSDAKAGHLSQLAAMMIETALTPTAGKQVDADVALGLAERLSALYSRFAAEERKTARLLATLITPRPRVHILKPDHDDENLF